MKIWKLAIFLILVFFSTIFLVYFYGKDSKIALTEGSLLPWNIHTIIRIDFDGPDKSYLTFLKKDGKWLIQNYFEAPLAKEALKVFTDFAVQPRVLAVDLDGYNDPVSKNNFNRRFVFYSADFKRKVIYLKSWGEDKVLASFEDENGIYKVKFPHINEPILGARWVNHDLYWLDKNQVTEIKFPSFKIIRKNNILQLSDLKPSEKTETNYINYLVGAIQNPDFVDILSRDNYELGELIFSYSVFLKHDVERVYSFYKIKGSPQPVLDKNTKSVENGWLTKEDVYLALRVTNQPFIFKISGRKLRELMNFKRRFFIEKTTNKTGDR